MTPRNRIIFRRKKDSILMPDLVAGYRYLLDVANAIANGATASSVPLIPSDAFIQPTAVNQPILNATGLDGKPALQNTGGNLKIYKQTNIAHFNGGVGTIQFVARVASGTTFCVENTGGTYNFQIQLNGSLLRLYTGLTGVKTLASGFVFNETAVHTFVMDGAGNMVYYKNGAFVSTTLIATYSANEATQAANIVALNNAFSVARPFCLFGYVTFSSEELIGMIGNLVTYSFALSLAQVQYNYNNYFRRIYTSLAA
jgi:hypothetical protein